MKKVYEIPETESIQVKIEKGLLTVTGGDDPVHEEGGVMPDDQY